MNFLNNLDIEVIMAFFILLPLFLTAYRIILRPLIHYKETQAIVSIVYEHGDHAIAELEYTAKGKTYNRKVLCGTTRTEIGSNVQNRFQYERGQKVSIKYNPLFPLLMYRKKAKNDPFTIVLIATYAVSLFVLIILLVTKYTN